MITDDTNSTDTSQMAQTVASTGWLGLHVGLVRKMAHSFSSTQMQVHGTWKIKSIHRVQMRSSDGLITLDQDVSEKDLGVILDPSLKFRENIRSRLNKASLEDHLVT